MHQQPTQPHYVTVNNRAASYTELLVASFPQFPDAPRQFVRPETESTFASPRVEIPASERQVAHSGPVTSQLPPPSAAANYTLTTGPVETGEQSKKAKKKQQSRAGFTKAAKNDVTEADDSNEVCLQRAKICPRCGNKFQGPEKMRLHYEKMHVAPSTKVTMPRRGGVDGTHCPKCGRVCSTKGNLQKHVAICGVTERTVACPICNKLYKCKWDVRNHLTQVHGNGSAKKAKFQCEHCQKGFAQHGLYDYHMNKEHLNERPHVCDGCGKAYYGQQSLKFHKVTCKESQGCEQKAQCSLCAKIFPSKHHARRHMRTVHEGTDRQMEKIACEFCGSYMSRRSMYRHVRQKHGHVIIKGELKPLEGVSGCDVSSDDSKLQPPSSRLTIPPLDPGKGSTAEGARVQWPSWIQQAIDNQTPGDGPPINPPQPADAPTANTPMVTESGGAVTSCDTDMTSQMDTKLHYARNEVGSAFS